MNNDIGIMMLMFGGLVFLAHLFAGLYKQKMLPDVLMLMLIGILIGPVLGLLDVSQLGIIGIAFPTFTLAVILFESGTKIDFSTLLKLAKPTLRLGLICYFVTSLIVMFVGKYLLHLDWSLSIVFGSIIGGVSSSVAIPLLKQLPLSSDVNVVLMLEAAITSVLCIVIPLACLQGIDSVGGLNLGNIIGSVLSSFLLAVIIGFSAAIMWSKVLDKVRTFQSSIFTTPCFVFIVYGLTESLGFSGAIAVFAFGLVLMNVNNIKNKWVNAFLGEQRHTLNTTELAFIQEISFLLKTFFFIYVGMSMMFNDWKYFAIGAIVTVMMLVSLI